MPNSEPERFQKSAGCVRKAIFEFSTLLSTRLFILRGEWCQSSCVSAVLVAMETWASRLLRYSRSLPIFEATVAWSPPQSMKKQRKKSPAKVRARDAHARAVSRAMRDLSMQMSCAINACYVRLAVNTPVYLYAARNLPS